VVGRVAAERGRDRVRVGEVVGVRDRDVARHGTERHDRRPGRAPEHAAARGGGERRPGHEDRGGDAPDDPGGRRELAGWRNFVPAPSMQLAGGVSVGVPLIFALSRWIEATIGARVRYLPVVYLVMIGFVAFTIAARAAFGTAEYREPRAQSCDGNVFVSLS